MLIAFSDQPSGNSTPSCSKTFSFLRNMQKTTSIKDYMNKIYSTKPKIVFYIENFHDDMNNLHTDIQTLVNHTNF